MIALALIATLLATQMAPARQSTAAAQTQGDAADAACMAAAITDSDYEDCARAWAERADAALDGAYAAVRGTLASPGSGEHCAATLALLDDSQAQWTRWRRTDCDGIWQLNAGGSIRNVEFLRCMARRASHRAAELRTDYGIAP